MTQRLRRVSSPRSLIAQLIDTPELGPLLRALPTAAFARLVQEIGVEDAGELIALATTEQLVRAFDEDLFRNARPGEREALDVKRFATWLEVLLEAGDGVAAQRVSELSEEFVAHALSGLVIVLDQEALREQMGDGGDEAERADKAIESTLSEELDGYLLLSREPDGWDAALALVLALDRDHRALLVRLMDRCAAISAHLGEDLEALSDVLSEGASLAEDVEAEREQRRSREGFVEPRAARGFLTLARTPPSDEPRDANTRAYFRELGPTLPIAGALPDGTAKLLAAVERLSEESERASAPARTRAQRQSLHGERSAFVEAMHALRDADVSAFDARTEELAYLANVLLAAGTGELGPFRPAEAAEAALATVALGAELEASAGEHDGGERGELLQAALTESLRKHTADRLFRVASSRLVGSADKRHARGYLLARGEVAQALVALRKPTRARAK